MAAYTSILKLAEPHPAAVVPAEEAAFTALVVLHQRMVYGIAQRALGRRQEAEDLAQEVFLTLYQHRDEIRSEQHLVSWLRQVTSRRCIDHRRRRRFGEEELPEIPVAPAAPDPWLEGALRQAVGRLPMRARLVVILRYQQDLEPAEIAPILGMPLATVKSHLRRSLDRLRRHFPEEVSRAQ